MTEETGEEVLPDEEATSPEEGGGGEEPQEEGGGAEAPAEDGGGDEAPPPEEGGEGEGEVKEEAEVVEEGPGSKIKLDPSSLQHRISVQDLFRRDEPNITYRNIKYIRDKDEDLGFCVRTGDGQFRQDGIFISRLMLGGIFDTYGILSVGDEIVKVNDADAITMTMGEVITSLFDCTEISLMVKFVRPVKSRFQKIRKRVRPRIDYSIDYKILQMTINHPPVERHVYVEEGGEVGEVEGEAGEEGVEAIEEG